MNDYLAMLEDKREKIQDMDTYSAVMRSSAVENNLQLVDHPISTPRPEDLTGLPRLTEEGTDR